MITHKNFKYIYTQYIYILDPVTSLVLVFPFRMSWRQSGIRRTLHQPAVWRSRLNTVWRWHFCLTWHYPLLHLLHHLTLIMELSNELNTKAGLILYLSYLCHLSYCVFKKKHNILEFTIMLHSWNEPDPEWKDPDTTRLSIPSPSSLYHHVPLLWALCLIKVSYHWIKEDHCLHYCHRSCIWWVGDCVLFLHNRCGSGRKDHKLQQERTVWINCLLWLRII